MALVVRTSRSSPQNKKTILYSDFNSNLDKTYINNDVLLNINEDSVKQSIKNILQTNTGERFFNPSFGSDVNRMLFENFSSASEQIVSDLIKTSINNFEPRANILDVIVNGSPDENYMEVTIIFSVINRSEPVTLELILNRIR